MNLLNRFLPETIGLLVGLGDVLFRLLATLAFQPAEARLFGPWLLGNIHHPNGPRAFGWDTLVWFGLGGVMLLVLYSAVRYSESAALHGLALFRASRALLAVAMGVLLLNVLESLLTGKVTNYFGLAYGSRFTAINLGDVVLWLSLLAFVPAIAAAFVAHFVGVGRAR